MKQTKADRWRHLAELLSEDDAAFLTTPIPGETKLSAAPIEAHDIDRRFEILGERVSGRLSELQTKMHRSGHASAADWTPWLSDVVPDRMIRDLLRRKTLNERAIEQLVATLGEHFALSFRLDQMVQIAREAAHEQHRILPKSIQDLAIRFNSAGLTAYGADHIYASKVEALVAYMNEPNSPAGREALKALLADRKEARSRDAGASVERAVTLLEAPSLAIDDAAPIQFENWMLDSANGKVYPDFWETNFPMSAPYVWTYRRATEDDLELQQAPLPTYENGPALFAAESAVHNSLPHYPKAAACGSACKKAPLSGVIGVQKGPLISMV